MHDHVPHRRPLRRAAAITASLVASLALAPSVHGSPADAAPDYTFADATLFASVGLGVLHHADHVLRDNHSGFPFTRSVTPFTASLLVYPILLTPYLLDAGPSTSLIANGAVLVGVQLAHTLAEPPADQRDPWADGSNLLGVTSPGLGRVAQGLSLALSAALVANLSANVIDGLRHGFTWKRARRGRPPRGAAVLPILGPDGTGAMLAFELD